MTDATNPVNAAAAGAPDVIKPAAVESKNACAAFENDIDATLDKLIEEGRAKSPEEAKAEFLANRDKLDRFTRSCQVREADAVKKIQEAWVVAGSIVEMWRFLDPTQRALVQEALASAEIVDLPCNRAHSDDDDY